MLPMSPIYSVNTILSNYPVLIDSGSFEFSVITATINGKKPSFLKAPLWEYPSVLSNIFFRWSFLWTICFLITIKEMSITSLISSFRTSRLHSENLCIQKNRTRWINCLKTTLVIYYNNNKNAFTVFYRISYIRYMWQTKCDKRYQRFQIILLNNLAKYIGNVGLYLLSIWIPRSSKKKLIPIPTRRLKNETSTVSPKW